MKKLARPLASLATCAALISPVALAVGVSAGPAAAHSTTSCTISPADRAAVLDRLAALHKQLKGTHATRAEKKALRAAIYELWTAARNAKMTSEVRAAKRAELARLRASLETADSATARDAVRAEIRAIRAELRAARLTKTERAALRAQAQTLRSALLGRPTAAMAKVLKAERATLKVSLRCHKDTVSVPAVTGL